MQVDNVKVAVALAYAFLAERRCRELVTKSYLFYWDSERFSLVDMFVDPEVSENIRGCDEASKKFKHICEMCSFLDNFQESLRAVLKSACRYSKRVHRDERKIVIHAAHRFLDTYTF